MCLLEPWRLSAPAVISCQSGSLHSHLCTQAVGFGMHQTACSFAVFCFLLSEIRKSFGEIKAAVFHRAWTSSGYSGYINSRCLISNSKCSSITTNHLKWKYLGYYVRSLSCKHEAVNLVSHCSCTHMYIHIMQADPLQQPTEAYRSGMSCILPVRHMVSAFLMQGDHPKGPKAAGNYTMIDPWTI